MRAPHSFRSRLGLVALVAFALRAAWALAIAPNSLTHQGDPRFFHLAANLLAGGHGYIAPLPFVEHGSAIATTEHPPGWSAVLAVLSAAGGDSYAVHELAGCAVGAGIVLCAGLLARRAGGERAGLIAAAIAALYPVFVALDGSLMSEPPYALGVGLCMIAAFRAVELPTLRRAAVLGLAIGLTALVRGEALGLLVFLVVPLVVAVPGRRLARAAVVWGVALVAIAPWCIRNSVTFHQPMLVSSEDGPVVAGANCDPTYHGRDTGYWRSDCVGLRSQANPALRSKALRRAGTAYARAHAARLPAVEGVRVLRTLGIWQPRRLVYFAEGRAMPGRTIAVACAWLVLALGIAGAVLMRRSPVRVAMLLAPLALALCTTLLAFGYPRFRYAADVALIVLAASALARIRAPRRRELRRGPATVGA